MPAKKAAPRKTAKKATQIGSARRETKAAAKGSRQASRRAAAGIQHSDRKRRLDNGIHAKKDTREARGDGVDKVAVGTPNVPGYTNQVDAAKYNAMKEILVAVLPKRAPGLTQGEMFDAARERASNNQFPGSTHRWWVKCVQLDLESKGAVVREDSTPLRWHVR